MTAAVAEVIRLPAKTKVCNKCGAEKPLAEFSLSPRSKTRKSHQCNACVRARQEKWNQQNAERNLQGVDLDGTKWCRTCELEKPKSQYGRRANSKSGISSECNDCSRVRDRKRYHRDPKRRILQERWRALRVKFGLSKVAWEALMRAQEGACAICRRLFDGPKNTCVDHCHTTDIVRGLLCRKCNFAIGLLGDDVETIERAGAYLRRAQ